MQARTRDTHDPPVGLGPAQLAWARVPVTDTQLNCTRTQKLTNQTDADDSRALYVYGVHSRIFLPLCAPVRQYRLRDAPRVGRHFVTCTHVTRLHKTYNYVQQPVSHWRSGYFVFSHKCLPCTLVMVSSCRLLLWPWGSRETVHLDKPDHAPPNTSHLSLLQHAYNNCSSKSKNCNDIVIKS